tara:strand:+ start:484 stop:837 length:354 start_codon:yes stop_codon:yes gene_type:complete
MAYGRVINGKLILDNKDDFQSDLYKFNGDVVLNLKELPKKKTNKQNNYYRGVVVKKLAQHLGYTLDEMHKELKREFKIETTKKLSQDEFQDYLDRIIRWASMFHGVALPDPTRLQQF